MKTAALILAAFALTFCQTANEWPIIHNINHTNFSPTTKLKPPLKVKWVTKVPGKFWCGPVVADGKLVAKDEGGYIFCLDAETGQLDWRYKVEGSGGGFAYPPAIFSGRVYAHIPARWSSRSFMYCWDIKTGDVLWKKTFGVYTQVGSDLVNVYQGPSPQKCGSRLFHISNVDINRAPQGGTQNINTQVQCWNAATGDSLWTYTMWGSACLNYSMVVVGDTIFASVGHALDVNDHPDSGRTVALDTNGNLIWSTTNNHVGCKNNQMQYHKGLLYVNAGAADGSNKIINASDGTFLSAYNWEGSDRALGAINDSVIFWRHYAQPPYGYKLKTGAELIRCRLFPEDLGHATGCPTPITGNGYVYTGFGSTGLYGSYVSDGNEWYAWDAKTGLPVWSFKNATHSCPPLAIAYDHLYGVTGSDGLIYCFENAQ